MQLQTEGNMVAVNKQNGNCISLPDGKIPFVEIYFSVDKTLPENLSRSKCYKTWCHRVLNLLMFWDET
jgi:hypothetical protein